MARPGISAEQFKSTMDALVAAGTPAPRVTLDALAGKLAASKSTLVRLRREYLAALPPAHSLPTVFPTAALEPLLRYWDSREAGVREEFASQLSQAEQIEHDLLAETQAQLVELEALRVQVADLTEKNASLDGVNQTLSNAVPGLQAQVATATERASAAEAAAAGAKSARDEIRLQLDQATERRLAAEAEAGLVREKLATLAAQLEAALSAGTTAAASSKARIDVLEAQLERTQAALDARVGEGRADAARAAAAEATAASLKERLDELKARLAEEHKAREPKDPTKPIVAAGESATATATKKKSGT